MTGPRLDAALLAEQTTLEAALRCLAESPALGTPRLDALCVEIETLLAANAHELGLAPYWAQRSPWSDQDAWPGPPARVHPENRLAADAELPF